MTEESAGGDRRRIAITAALATLSLAALVLVAVLSGGDSGPEGFASASVPPREVGDLDRAADLAGCEAVDADSEGRHETGDDVEYRADPPHSGPHAPQPATDGAYRTDPPPEENLVHSLYHGRIIIWFGDELDEEEIGSLKALFDEDSDHMMLVPRQGMRPAVAATGWTHSLTCPEMNDAVFDAIRAFRDTFRDTAPEFVP